MQPSINRSLLVLAIDAVLAALAVYASFALRLDPSRYDAYQGIYVLAVYAAILALLFGRLFKTHWILWRFVSARDVVVLAQSTGAIALSIAFLAFADLVPFSVPRSIPIIFGVVHLMFVCGARIAYRLVREFREGQKELVALRRESGGVREPRRRVLLVGSAERLELFLRANHNAIKDDIKIVGLVTPKRRYVGTRIRGSLVRGTVHEIDTVIDNLLPRVDVVAFLDEALKPHRGLSTFAMIDRIRNRGLDVMRLGSTSGVTRASLFPNLDLKSIRIEDLLRRPVRVTERRRAVAALAGRTVLVTGAGGSVGSELCRQIADCKIGRLVLAEISEFNLYQIELELVKAHPTLDIVPVLADVRDCGHIDALFKYYKPHAVFHAAALKHVPLVEMNSTEAVLTNVLGTKTVVDAALKHDVKGFVLVSTDKAVHPTSLMGVTKRIAELYVQARAFDQSKGGSVQATCKLLSVRFGNVLGSSGSVIPCFRDQVARGGPVTVTHRDMQRFFMTIGEAATLILEGFAVLGKERVATATFILDMGEPVKILDLAEQIISLSGYKPYDEIDIQFTGLRPGEKLFEELQYSYEDTLPTAIDIVHAVASREPPPEAFLGQVATLLDVAANRDNAQLVRSLALKLVDGHRCRSELEARTQHTLAASAN